MVILLLLIGLNSPLLAQEQGCGPLEKVAQNIEVEWFSDSFDATTHLKEFWNIHKRFGFLRYKNRVILVARDRAMADTVLKDIEKLGSKGEWHEVEIPELAGGFKFDVTERLPDLVRRLHAISFRYDGPNCWNFCLRQLVTHGSMPMSANEFHHWMSSPLAMEIKNFRDLQMGDIIVFRNNVPPPDLYARTEQHGAVYLSENLALAKSALGRYFPPRLLDLHEAIAYYYPKKSEYVRVYRLRNIEEAARRIDTPEAGELRRTIAESIALEQKTDAVYTGKDGQGEKISYQEVSRIVSEFEEYGSLLRQRASAHVTRLEKIPLRTPDQEVELALWRGLEFKAHTYTVLHLEVD